MERLEDIRYFQEGAQHSSESPTHKGPLSVDWFIDIAWSVIFVIT